MLEDEADAPALRGLAGGVDAVEVHAPCSGVSRPPMMRSSVVLPDPDGPSSATSSPGSTVEVDAIKRRVRAEAVRDALHLDAHASTPAASISSTDEARHSTICRPTSVTRASVVSSDATANAAVKLYSL